MEEKLGQLLQDEFETAAARDANVAISRARRKRAGCDPDDEGGPALRAYEMVLSNFEAFATALLPRLVYHLESIGARLPECKGVIVAAFEGDRLHFLDAKALIARACKLLGVSPADLVARHGTGERTTAVREGPLLLPGPKGPQ
jgi:hypothetical protein